MARQFLLSGYVQRAMEEATYDKLDGGSYSGRIPRCQGVIAFAGSLSACEDELRSTLEEWILLDLKLRHPLSVIGSIDLNKEPAREPVDSL